MRQLFSGLRLSLLILMALLKRNLNLTLSVLAIVLFLIFLQLRFSILDAFSAPFSQGFVGTYQEHDLPPEFLRLLSSPLVEFDIGGRLMPKIALSWEVNHDATIFKFHLRDDLFWSDGTKFKSSDLEFPISNSQAAFPDDRTIEFTLKESYSPFPSLLIRPLFKKGTLIGLGPYRIKKIEKSRIFITKINLEPLSLGLPQSVVRFYPNEKTALLGFELGEVRALMGVSLNQQILASRLVKLNQYTDYSKIVGIFYNTADGLLSNRSFRQALSYQAPKIEHEDEARGPIYPFSWAYNKEAKTYLSQTTLAKDALERAKTTKSDVLEKELILTTTPQLEIVARKIIVNWRELGVNVILRVESGLPQNFQALLITQSIPFDPDQYALWHSTQKTNFTKYTQARIDKDLEDARKDIKEEDRKEKYLDFQKVLLEDVPATFLYFPKYNVIYLKKAESQLNQVLDLELNSLLKN